MGVLDGKAAIVTGSARGIGRGIALKLAEAGANVAMVDLGSPKDPALTYNLAAHGELASAVDEVKSQVRDVHVTEWGDAGVVTCIVDQTYTMEGQRQEITAIRQAVIDGNAIFPRSPAKL